MAFSLDEITDDINSGIKGKKLNKGVLIIGGVVVVIVLVLFNQRRSQAPPIEAETIPDIELAGYPRMNPADLEDTFANYSSVVLGEVGSNLDDFQSDIMDILSQQQEQNQKYIDDVKEGLEKQIGTDPQTVEKKNSAGWTIGFGVHGEGNPSSNIDLKTNRTALKEEIERTQSVISYRESKGLDVTEQNKYMNKIKGY